MLGQQSGMSTCLIGTPEDVYAHFDDPARFRKRMHGMMERVERRMELIARLNPRPDFLLCGGSESLVLTTPNTFRELVWPVLKGNLHTTEVMLRGSVEDVTAASKKAIDDAATGGGFILSTDDQCGRDTPDENLRAMISKARDYGKYSKKLVAAGGILYNYCESLMPHPRGAGSHSRAYQSTYRCLHEQLSVRSPDLR